MKSILDKVLKVMNLPKGSLSKREEKIALEAYKLGRSSKQEKPDYKQSDIDKVVRYVKTRLRDLDILDMKVKKASFSDEWLNILITGFDRDPVKMDAICLIEKELEEQGSSNVLLIPYIE